MNLGNYFTLEELEHTSSGILNQVEEDQHLVNLTRLVTIVLDPLRSDSGPLYITSGYRCKELNDSLGSKDTSYHRYGCAADVVSPNRSVQALAWRIQEMKLPFDKIIKEYRGDTEWLHIQIAPPGGSNRNQVWRADQVNGKMEYTRQ